MKTILYLAISMVLVIPSALAQGSLEFNQAILINSTSALTVPAGKVWKIQSAVFPKVTYIKFSGTTGGSCGCSSSSSYSKTQYTSTNLSELTNGNMSVDGTVYDFGSSIPWLPAGTQVAAVSVTSPVQQSTPASGCYSPYWIDGAYVGCGSGYTPPQASMTSIISVLEFNIVP